MKDAAQRPPNPLTRAFGGRRGTHPGKEGSRNEKILHCLREQPQCPADALALPWGADHWHRGMQDYRLLFKGSKTGSYLTVEPEKGCTVPVAVWEVTEQDELALDRYEGYPSFYYKTEMTLDVKGIRTGKLRRRRAFVYIMREERPYGVPANSYLSICGQGYRFFGFPVDKLLEACRYSRERMKPYEGR